MARHMSIVYRYDRPVKGILNFDCVYRLRDSAEKSKNFVSDEHRHRLRDVRV